MSNATERRRLEQAVITAARDFVAAREWTPAVTTPIRAAIQSLDALELGPTDRTKSRGVECTSEMAAAFMHGRKARELSGHILRRLLRGAYTVDELVDALGRRHQSVSARVNELRDNGWIKDSGKTRPTRSGVEAIVWELTPRAHAELTIAFRELP